MTISTLKKGQSAKKRIKISTRPQEIMPAQWDDATFEEKLCDYLNLKDRLKTLETAKENMQAELLEYYKANDLQSANIGNEQVCYVEKKTWRYSDETRREAERIKNLQAKERKDALAGEGEATYTVSTHLQVRKVQRLDS
ncbi:MAG: hypothetical protein VXX91_08265 [Planctomycetota bacterium]|nr:hypothetical protein [Planctomycetota bacterium]